MVRRYDSHLPSVHLLRLCGRQHGKNNLALLHLQLLRKRVELRHPLPPELQSPSVRPCKRVRVCARMRARACTSSSERGPVSVAAPRVPTSDSRSIASVSPIHSSMQASKWSTTWKSVSNISARKLKHVWAELLCHCWLRRPQGKFPKIVGATQTCVRRGWHKHSFAIETVFGSAVI